MPGRTGNVHILKTNLQTLTEQDFLNLGHDRVAYARPLDMGGMVFYSLHGADGQQLGMMDDFESLESVAHEKDMTLCTLH